MNEEQAKEYHQCQQTLQMMECGTLELNQLIKYGILLVGKTKAGKTTTSHYLTHQVLEGGYNDQNNVVYKLRQTDRKYINAKIGDFQHKSQTRIPNVFEFNDDNNTTYLIDCPGYLDTFGFYRIISNRFFHYQVFSKVQNAKFIITFAFTDMRRSADIVKATFKQFLTGFENLEKIKKQIFDATCIMITNVPKNNSLQFVMQSYSKSPNNIGDQDLNNIYKQLQKLIVQKKRVYIFYQAQLGKICQTDNTLLSDISSNTKYWSRKLNNVNNIKQVDMSDINLSVIKYLDQGKTTFEKQLKFFEKYYSQQIQTVFTCFKKVLQQLAIDTQQGQQGYKFMQLVISQVQQKTKWRESNQDYKFLYEKYKKKRQNLQQQLFSQKQKESSQSIINTTTDLPFWACKFSIFERIQKIITKTQQTSKKNANNKQRQQHQLIYFCQSINKIMMLILKLAKCKKLNEKKQKNKYSYFIQYAYQLYKNIQISNKMWRMSNSSKQQKPSQLNEFIQKNFFFILVKYPSIIRTMILKTIKATASELLPKILDKIQLNTGLTTKSSQYIIEIFQEHLKYIKENQIHQQQKQDITRKINDLMARVKNNSLDFLSKQQNPVLSNLQEMENHRKKIYEQIKQCRLNAFQNQNLKVEHNKIIMLMAQCLFKNSRLQLAKQLYDTIFNGHKVLEIFKLQESPSKKTKDLYLNYLIQYMKAAKKYRRCEQALTIAQEAYNEAMHESKKQQVSLILSFIKEILKGGCCRNFNDPYAQFLFEEVPDVDLPEQLSKKILKQAEMNKREGDKKVKKEEEQKNAKRMSGEEKKKISEVETVK